MRGIDLEKAMVDGELHVLEQLADAAALGGLVQARPQYLPLQRLVHQALPLPRGLRRTRRRRHRRGGRAPRRRAAGQRVNQYTGLGLRFRAAGREGRGINGHTLDGDWRAAPLAATGRKGERRAAAWEKREPARAARRQDVCFVSTSDPRPTKQEKAQFSYRARKAF